MKWTPERIRLLLVGLSIAWLAPWMIALPRWYGWALCVYAFYAVWLAWRVVGKGFPTPEEALRSAEAIAHARSIYGNEVELCPKELLEAAEANAEARSVGLLVTRELKDNGYQEWVVQIATPRGTIRRPMGEQESFAEVFHELDLIDARTLQVWEKREAP